MFLFIISLAVLTCITCSQAPIRPDNTKYPQVLKYITEYVYYHICVLAAQEDIFFVMFLVKFHTSI
jgi:hypothetical protein